MASHEVNDDFWGDRKSTPEERQDFLDEMRKIVGNIANKMDINRKDKARGILGRNRLYRKENFYLGTRESELDPHVFGPDDHADLAVEITERIKALREQFPDKHPDTWALITVVSTVDLVE